MSGIYFYGDFCSGRIWGLSFDGTSWQNTEYLDSAVHISSFGEDVNGQVYVVDLNGAVYRLEGTGTTTPGPTPTRINTPTRTPTLGPKATRTTTPIATPTRPPK
jgi:hypothetical protein